MSWGISLHWRTKDMSSSIQEEEEEFFGVLKTAFLVNLAVPNAQFCGTAGIWLLPTSIFPVRKMLFLFWDWDFVTGILHLTIEVCRKGLCKSLHSHHGWSDRSFFTPYPETQFQAQFLPRSSCVTCAQWGTTAWEGCMVILLHLWPQRG